MVELQGLWRLEEAHSWDVNGHALPAPYGTNPIGQIAFSNDRMLASLCNGDALVTRKRDFMSYGGVFTFNGEVLDCLVDIASDPHRIGQHEIRQVKVVGSQILLRPPARMYGERIEQRELLWSRVWSP
jgi:hypothetical protein